MRLQRLLYSGDRDDDDDDGGGSGSGGGGGDHDYRGDDRCPLHDIIR